MKPEVLFYIIVGIVIFSYVLGRVLEYLNYTRYDQKLPDEVSDVYDQEQYQKSQNYKKVNYRFSIITGTFSVLLILVMFFLEGFAFVDQLVRTITINPVLMAILFIGILLFASDVINTPFSIYDTFVIEEKFGFNKTSVRTFIQDKVKGWLLGAVIGGGILATIVWLYQLTNEYFWVLAWIIISLFSIFMTMFYSTLIVPIFNKQIPLEEGELRGKIMAISEEIGFKIKNIFVIDGSKRSTKANAYFSGLGVKKRIVLFDTLIEELSHDEILAVLTHEIGHYKKKHTVTGTILSVIHSGIILYIFSLFVGNPLLSEALGVSETSFHIALITFGFLYSPISTLLGLGMNVMSRKHEYQADRFAGEKFKPEPLIDALKSLSRKNLSNLTPHPVYVWFNYSHPTLLQRIRALRSI
ncbi:MAG: peptidase M48 [Bacteroides sp. SM23_62_1]|nr:MAG: peptidase M48 [Bacteroides sp. SM23_62_1]